MGKRTFLPLTAIALLALAPIAGPATASTLSDLGGTALVQGVRKPGDKLLFEFRLARRFKALQVLTESVVYPMTTGQRPGTITVVDVRSPRRHLDDVSVKSGGVGHKFAKIRFRSARGRGLDYVVKIYGFPEPTATPTPDGDREVGHEHVPVTGSHDDGVDVSVDAPAEVTVGVTSADDAVTAPVE